MKVGIDGNQLNIQFLPLQSKENKEYILLDTGCVLNLLRRFSTLKHRLGEGRLKLAILEHTIDEVDEHLSKSKSAMIKKGSSTFGVHTAIENFRKFVQDDRIRKVGNPTISGKALSDYRKFGEDNLLAYVLYEGSFKAVATQDRQLAEKIGEKRSIPCHQLWEI